MSKVLVVYATSTGCTTGVAERIGETLSEAGIEISVSAAAQAPDPSDFDAVIVGSGVRAGQWHAAARSWVTANADALKALPVAFFTCGLTTASEPGKADEVRAYTDALIEATGVAPIDVGVFAGWNEPKTFSMPERLIMKVMKAPQGDFRDFEAIAAWARQTVPALGLAD